MGGAIGGAFSWALVNLDHFAFVRRFLIFVVAHNIELGRERERTRATVGNKQDRKGRRDLKSTCGRLKAESCDSRVASREASHRLSESAESQKNFTKFLNKKQTAQIRKAFSRRLSFEINREHRALGLGACRVQAGLLMVRHI